MFFRRKFFFSETRPRTGHVNSWPCYSQFIALHLTCIRFSFRTLRHVQWCDVRLHILSISHAGVYIDHISLSFPNLRHHVVLEVFFMFQNLQFTTWFSCSSLQRLHLDKILKEYEANNCAVASYPWFYATNRGVREAVTRKLELPTPLPR